MAATAQPRTGRTHRPRRPDLSRTGLAYQAGRDGEAAPSWIGDDPKLEDAYERGVSDREAAEAGAPARDDDHQADTRRSSISSASPAPRASRPAAKSRKTSSGGRQARTPRPRSGGRLPPVGRPTLTPPRRLSASDGSGFMLGLVLYALGLNYLRYGWPGVTGWLKAKFVNNPNDFLDAQLSKEARQGHGPHFYNPGKRSDKSQPYRERGLPGAPMGPVTGG